MQSRFLRRGYALLLALIFCLLVPGALAQDATGVSFSDAEFERLLTQALGKAEGDPITTQELAGIHALGVYGNVLVVNTLEAPAFFQEGSFTALPDLALFPALTELAVWYQPMDNLEDLRPLTGLTVLSVASLPISDLDPLSGMAGLTELTVRDAQVADVSALSGLTELTSLSMWNNQLSSLAGLEHLQKLTFFAAWNNHINDIGPLGQLPELVTLDLYRNQVSDVSPLADSTSLRCLSVSENPIHDVSSLSKLKRLINLYITFDGDQITGGNIRRILPDVYVAE